MNQRAGEYTDARTGSFVDGNVRAALLQLDQPREPFVHERLLLAPEGGDDEGVLLAQVAEQVVVAPVAAAPRERR